MSHQSLEYYNDEKNTNEKFIEGKINFYPTYKIDQKNNTYKISL